MSKMKRPSWKSHLPRFWKTAVKYRKLLIGLLISIFLLVIVGGALQPIYFPILKSSDILLPEGHFNTSTIYIEEYKKGYRDPDPSFSEKVTDYNNKRQMYKLGFAKSNNQNILAKEIFPVKANGKDRLLMIGSPNDIDSNLNYIYLMDIHYKILDRVALCESIYTLIVSQKFTDRAWYQIGPDGSGEYIFMYEMDFSGDKINKKQIGRGGSDYTGNETYKIINVSKNPRIVLYKGNIADYLFFLLFFPFSLHYLLLSNWLYALLLFLFIILLKLLKPHLIYISSTFLSLFKHHQNE